MSYYNPYNSGTNNLYTVPYTVPNYNTIPNPQSSTLYTFPKPQSPKLYTIPNPQSSTLYTFPKPQSSTLYTGPNLQSPTLYTGPNLQSSTLYTGAKNMVSNNQIHYNMINKPGSTIIDNNFIKPLDIHKQYGVIDIPGIEVINIEISNKKDKKYAITVKYDGITKTLHYGNSDYQQYHDRTPIGAFSSSDHNDEGRRKSYLSRSSKITNKYGLAANDPFSPNRYAIITLW
jgi:hypothetical protein